MFTPHTPQEIEQMLREIGVKSIEELFEEVPDNDDAPELASSLSGT